MKSRHTQALKGGPISAGAAAAVQAKFSAGLALHQQGDFPGAQKLYLEVLQIYPQHADALHLSGVIAYQAKDIDRALALYDRALALHPQNPVFLNSRGVALKELRRWDEALAAYDRAINLDPNFGQAFNNRGSVLLELRRVQEALASFDRAAHLNPTDVIALNNRGLALQKLDRLEDALTSYAAAININAGNADAHYHRGVVLQRLARLPAALASYDLVIGLNSAYAEAHSSRGTVLKEMGRLEEALQSYETALQLKPDAAEYHYNRAAVLQEMRRHPDALAGYGAAVILKPDYAEAFNNRGTILLELGDLDGAMEAFTRAIRLKPDFAEAHNNRGNVLFELAQFQDAWDSYVKATQFKPDYAMAHYNAGNALRELARPDEALASYDRAIELKPDSTDAHNNRGAVLLTLLKPDKALGAIDQAIKLKPDSAEAHNNRGRVFFDLARPEEALACYDRAIELKPGFAEAHNNRGGVLLAFLELDKALAAIDQAIELRPDFAKAHNNRGRILFELGQVREAWGSYVKAIEFKPDYALAYKNVGDALSRLGLLDEALKNYEWALHLDPDIRDGRGFVLYAKTRICEWSGIGNQILDLRERAGRGERVAEAFTLSLFTDHLPALQKAAEICSDENRQANPELPAPTKSSKRTKIRLGYFSSDYFNHPVGFAIAEIFERHNKRDFEIVAFSSRRIDDDATRLRVRNAVDDFVDIGAMSDRAVALLSREMGIDVAVDLNGLTDGGRMGIFSRRAAPVQVNYLGYSGSVGAQYIDYIIADKTLIPDHSRQFYTEHIAILPHTCLPKGARIGGMIPTTEDKKLSRQNEGLPDSGFVFCCFNHTHKILPELFDAWMRILKRVNGSVLWLSEYNSFAGPRLQKEAQARGVDPERLIFAKRAPELQYMQRYCIADMFLDTWPYNAGSMARECLWAGLPLLTLTGDSYFSRMAASLLNVLELPELITSKLSEYEQTAVDLAHDPLRLKQIASKLAQNRIATPCFDTGVLTRNIEQAYTQMYERYRADLPPEDISVA